MLNVFMNEFLEQTSLNFSHMLSQYPFYGQKTFLRNIFLTRDSISAVKCHLFDRFPLNTRFSWKYTNRNLIYGTASSCQAKKYIRIF